MTFLPVVERELRAASRRRRTYWTRFLAVVITLCVWGWIWWVSGPRSLPHQRAQAMFYSISALVFAYALFAGVGVTADSLSEEKREGTLGLLFLTDLKGHDVILGKLAATSMDSLYRLIAVFPVLAIPLLMGGLTLDEFWRMALVLVNTLLFSLAAGMFVSALSRQPHKAAALTFGIVLLVTALPPALGLIHAVGRPQVPYDQSFLLSSPAYAYALAFDATYKIRPREFWLCIGGTHGLTWLLLGLASVILPHAWQDRPASTRNTGRLERLRDARYGRGAERTVLRTRLLELNPFLWLWGRDRLRSRYLFAVLALFALVWFGLVLLISARDIAETMTLIVAAFGAHTVLKFCIAAESCRQIAEDRRSGALELLLSTPASVSQIVSGHLLALKRQFFQPVIGVLLGDLLIFWAVASHLSQQEDFTAWTFFFSTTLILFVTDLYTLAWTGFWHGLTCKSSNRAAWRGILQVLALPVLLYVGLLTIFVAISQSFSYSANPGVLLIGLWLLIGLATDLVLYTSSRSNLFEHFRTVATQRFSSGAMPLPGADNPSLESSANLESTRERTTVN